MGSDSYKIIWDGIKQEILNKCNVYQFENKARYFDDPIIAIHGPIKTQRKIVIVFEPTFMTIKFWCRRPQEFGLQVAGMAAERQYEFADPNGFDVDIIILDIVTWLDKGEQTAHMRFVVK